MISELFASSVYNGMPVFRHAMFSKKLSFFGISVRNGICLKVSQLRQLPCLRAFHWDLTIPEEIGRLPRPGVGPAPFQRHGRHWNPKELAQTFQRLGCEVTVVIGTSGKIMGKEDDDASELVPRHISAYPVCWD